MAEHGAAHKAHGYGPVGGDGADVQAMHPGDRLFLYQQAAVFALELAVARIGAEAVAAVLEEAQAPLPVAIAELAVAPGAADRCQCLGRFESRAAGQAGEVLEQHVDRGVWLPPFLHQASGQAAPQGAELQQFEGMGGHEQHLGGAAGVVGAAASSLQQPGHIFS